VTQRTYYLKRQGCYVKAGLEVENHWGSSSSENPRADDGTAWGTGESSNIEER